MAAGVRVGGQQNPAGKRGKETGGGKGDPKADGYWWSGDCGDGDGKGEQNIANHIGGGKLVLTQR